jgi:hypothetical protein
MALIATVPQWLVMVTMTLSRIASGIDARIVRRVLMI